MKNSKITFIPKKTSEMVKKEKADQIKKFDQLKLDIDTKMKKLIDDFERDLNNLKN